MNCVSKFMFLCLIICSTLTLGCNQLAYTPQPQYRITDLASGEVYYAIDCQTHQVRTNEGFNQNVEFIDMQGNMIVLRDYEISPITRLYRKHSNSLRQRAQTSSD